MAESKEVQKRIIKKVKKERQMFLDVDVFRSSFGPVSEKAIYDVFQTTFNVQKYNMKNYSFSHCVESLRKYKLKHQEQ